MAKFKWTVTVDGVDYSDTLDMSSNCGELRVRCDVPAGRIEEVTAQFAVSMASHEKAFFNGFQAWTHSPEYQKDDVMTSMNGMPQWLVDKFHLDRYGDYYFVDYLNEPGLFHGFSWCYVRRGEHYRLMASLDERPGYTVFRLDAERGIMFVERDCAGLLHEGGELAAFDLFFAEGSEDEVFDAWFDAMGVKSRNAAPIKGYSSWYNRFNAITEDTIVEDLEGCITLLEPGDVFQIDDGWESKVGDWLEPKAREFSMGMDVMAELIHMPGFKAGLWIAPFVCEKKSKLFREHPDWLLQVYGEPWACGCNWSDFYALDIDNAEVREYLKQVFDRVFNEWGYDFVKLDFLYAAAPFGSDTETRAGKMIRALEMLREWCGDKLILGCGVPLMPAFGIVDYCRIGCDVSLNFDGDWYLKPYLRERMSTKNAMDNIVNRRQLNGRAFGSDPDVFFLRDENISLSDEQKLALAELDAEYGSVLFTSDNPTYYTPEARAVYKELVERWQG